MDPNFGAPRVAFYWMWRRWRVYGLAWAKGTGSEQKGESVSRLEDTSNREHQNNHS